MTSLHTRSNCHFPRNMGRLALSRLPTSVHAATMMSSEQVRVWGHQARDGTWRGRVFASGQRIWECGHPHACIEDAWRCAERHRERRAYLSSTREQV